MSVELNRAECFLSSPYRPKLPHGVGVGLKQQHIAELRANPSSVDFIEVHAENFMVPGPKLDMLLDVSKIWPVSIHGVALSLGGEDPLDEDHLKWLRLLIDAVKPASFSEHIAWSQHKDTYFNDLLPVPYNKVSLNRLVDRIDQVQQYLGRKVLFENPSTYIRFKSDTIFEADFIAELVHRTNCGLLLDINNLYVSAKNHSWDAKDWLSRIQLDAVGEVHLAGYETNNNEHESTLLIDTHGADIDEPVWALYSDFLSLAGSRPTLIERDNNIPPLDVLLHEVKLAQRLLRSELRETA